MAAAPRPKPRPRQRDGDEAGHVLDRSKKTPLTPAACADGAAVGRPAVAASEFGVLAWKRRRQRTIDFGLGVGRHQSRGHSLRRGSHSQSAMLPLCVCVCADKVLA